MDFLSSLKRLETEFEDFVGTVEDFFSPGFDKYNAYTPFQESFAGDFTLDAGFSGMEEIDQAVQEAEQKDEMEDEGETNPHPNPNKYKKLGFFYPGFEIRRVPAHSLGYGVLGRCFPYSGIIEIRNDLYGDEFNEVLTHELTHMANPQWSELDVRIATRNKLPFSPKWH